MATETLSLPESSAALSAAWRYLEERPHPWRRQLYVKGRSLRAFSVWSDLTANALTVEEIAQSRALPPEAVHECIRYCEENRSLLEDECNQEKLWLLARGLEIEPPPAH